MNTHTSFSDIRFVIGEERQTIYAHKCLLAARCEVFRAMFAVPQGEEAPTPLVLSDIKPSIFLAVLEFIYTNCSSLSTDMVSQRTQTLVSEKKSQSQQCSQNLSMFTWNYLYTRSAISSAIACHFDSVQYVRILVCSL